jgi:hypothetical protein
VRGEDAHHIFKIYRRRTMKKLIVCGAFVLGVLAMGGQLTSAQACEGGKCCKPKPAAPAPDPAPEEGAM